MNELELMGVQEMDVNEMQTTDGGNAAGIFLSIIGTQVGVAGLALGIATGGVALAAVAVTLAAVSLYNACAEVDK
ncbi:MAG: hypothetical protein ACERKD_22860 [Prolixibacteraceae bacterium]